MMKLHLVFWILALLSNYAAGQHTTQDQRSSDANEYMFRSSVDHLAKAFDSSERDEWQKPEEVIRFLGDVRDKTIIDLGSGSGYFSLRLAKAGAKVIAADVSDEFIEIIEEKKKEYDIPNESLITVLVPEGKLALEPGTADFLFMVNVYHHISDRIDYFKEANQVLKDTGKIVIVDFYKKSIPVGPPKDHKISRQKVLEELRSAGYRDIQQDTVLLDYQYIITASAF